MGTKFNARLGVSVGNTPTDVVDANGSITANTLTVNRTVSAGNTTITGFANVVGNVQISDTLSGNNMTLSGNLTVSGTTTYINTTNLNIGDNIITLNADLGAVAPSENAGIEVNRGTSANVAIRWDESIDRWTATNDGATYANIAIGAAGATLTANGTDTATYYFPMSNATSGSWTNAVVDDVITFVPSTNLFTLGGDLSVSGNISGTAANVQIVAGSFTTTFANNGLVSFPSSIFIGNSSVNTTANSIGITTTGFVNATASVNSAVLSVGTAVVANSTGITTTGFANIASTANIGGVLSARSDVTVNGALTVANTAALGNTTVTGFVNATSSVNSAILSVGTAFIANSTGAYHTGTVNATSVTVGTDFIANSTGVTTTGFANVGTTVSIGANVVANTTALFVGNSTVNTVITSANITSNSINANNLTSNIATFNTSANVGANVQLTTSQLAIGNATVNTVITSSSIATQGTLATGNTTHDGFLNVSSTANIGGILSARSDVTVNGALTVANTAALGNTTVTGFVNATSSVNSAILSVGTNFIANTTGAYHTGTINTASHTVGTDFIANSTGVTTTGFANVATTISVGANVIANTTALFVGNSTVNTVITQNTLQVANATGSTLSVAANGNVNIGSSLNVATTFASGNATITGFANISGNLQVTDTIAGNNLTLSGNLTVSGTTTYINTTALNIGDNIIVLNADLGAVAPTENAGFEINRGTSANVAFLWNETSDYWDIGNTNVTGFVNATASVNSAILSVGTNFIANTTGAYHTGTVNAASHTVGTDVIANSTGITTTGFVNATASVNSAILSVGAAFIANSTGVTTTGFANVNSLQVATTITANGSLGTAGQVLQSNSTGGAYWAAAGGGGSGATLVANTTDTQTFYIPMSNATSGSWTNAVVDDIITFVPSTDTLTLGAGSIVVGNSTVNTVISSTIVSLGANSTTTALAVVANGNIGIGNTTPAEKLVVTGTINATSVAVGSGGLTANSIGITTTGFANVATTISVGANVIANTTSLFVGNSTVNTVITQNTLQVANATATAFLVAANGNIGIGNNAPGHPLSVNGNINSNTYSIAGTAYINSNRAITQYGTTHNALGSGSGSRTIDIALGNFVSATVAGTTTWTFSNPLAAPAATGFVLELTNGGSAALTWPAAVKWPGGTAPSLTAAGIDVLTFITDDGGTTWRGVASMLDSK